MIDIKTMRLRTHLTQDEFSRLTGIPVVTLHSWERGKRVPPPYVVKLLDYFLDTSGAFAAGAASPPRRRRVKNSVSD